jgi:hypothetical protein
VFCDVSRLPLKPIREVPIRDEEKLSHNYDCFDPTVIAAKKAGVQSCLLLLIVAGCLERGCAPHVAQNNTYRHSAIGARPPPSRLSPACGQVDDDIRLLDQRIATATRAD